MANTAQLDVLVKGRDELSPTLSQLESRVIRWVGAISASIAAVKIGGAPIIAAANFERELANVTKTTNFTRSEINQLSKALLDMSTRTDVATLDLAKIAAAAGQQGLGRFGVEGVTAFTESVARMASVLDITAEEAGDNIGKIVNIFKIPLKDIESAVSTFNQVSNNSTAKGKELLDVVKRIGDAAGSLNLQQATALAATALDFGTSPEVAGTAFSKVFASLREKASELSRLLKMDTESWIKMVEQDGLSAFQKVLGAFRELKPEDQQKAIVKLFGGGRIGALLNKLVQDTQDVVLRRNFEQAIKGMEGTSAIREQQTVLNTLVAQSKAALNSLFKLGVDTAEGALVPLTQYVAQLNTALQSDSVRSFLQSIAKAAMDMVDGLASAVKFVASLNINWENFIRVVNVFLGLKLAEYLTSSVGKALTGMADRLKYVATGVDAAAEAAKKTTAAQAGAAAAQTSADAAFKTSISSRLLGYEDLERKIKEYLIAKRQEVAAEAEVAAASKAAADARRAAAVTGGRNTAATSQLASAAQIASQQRAAMIAVERQADAAQAEIARTRMERMAASEAASGARRLQIEQDFQTKKAAILATGSRAGLSALQRERATLLAAEEASYQRSLRGIESYYARRAALAAQGSAQLIAAERAAYMARLGEFDGAVTKQAGAAAVAAGGAAAVKAADAALTQTTAKLSIMQAATLAAGAAWTKFGLIVRTAASVIVAAGRLILSSLMWVTVVYSIADAFGLIDKLGDGFQKLTDKIGLTSAASRQAAIEHEKQTQKIKEQQKALEDLIKKYEEFTDANTGQIDRKEIDRLMTISSTSEDAATRQQALAGLEEMGRALAAKREEIIRQVGESNTANIAAERKKIADFVEEIRRLNNEQGKTQINFDSVGAPIGTTTVDNTAKIQDLYRAIEQANRNIQDFSKNTQVMGNVLKGTDESTSALAKSVASLFTPETLAFAQEHMTAYADLSLQLKDAKEQKESLEQQARGGDQAIIQQAEAAKVRYQNLASEVAATRARILELIATQLAMPGVTPEVMKTWEQLKILVDASAGVMKGIINNAAAAPTDALTGKGANPNTKSPTSGGGTFTPPDRGAESRARREARARLELERARIQAENALKEELAKQALEEEARFYERGLRSLVDYYDQRRSVQLQANQFDIDDKKRELVAAEREAADAKQKADKDKFTATAVRLQGEINVLEAQRKAIVAQNDEEERRATEAFTDRMRQETNTLREQGLLGAGVLEGFQGNLDELLAQYRVFLNQLRSEGQGALADALTNGLRLDALQRSLNPIRDDFRRAQDQLSNYQSRLNLAMGQGILTATQVEVAYSQAIDAQAEKLQGFIDKQTELLRQNEALRGTRPYQNMVDDIERARIALAELRQEQNKTAIDFNNQTRDSLSNFLGNLQPTFTSLRESFIGFLLSITQNIQRTLGNSIADAIMQGLGQTGSGGLGGWIQSVIKGPESLAAKGLAEPGSSVAFPMYTKSVDNLMGLTDGLNDVFPSDIFDQMPAPEIAPESLDGLVSGVGAAVGNPMESLMGSLGGLFGGLTETLTSLFTSLLSSLGGLGGGGGGGLFGAIAGLFGAAHTGGIAGQPKMYRRVDPRVFANALRYHNGGVAGLKPKEVPTILEEGETIRTKQQEAALQAQLKNAGAGGGTQGEIGIRNVLVVDPNFVPDAMNTAQGEKLVLSILSRNAATVRNIVK